VLTMYPERSVAYVPPLLVLRQDSAEMGDIKK
jgi:hypothetical protein